MPRRLKRLLAGSCLAILYACGVSDTGEMEASTTPAPPDGRWPVRKAQEWYKKQPWLVGCNFVPSTAVNDVEMWQKETFDPKTIDRELAWARSLGFNTVRVFLNYVVWEADPKGMKQRFGKFLEIAGKHSLLVMPILFDDCFKPEPAVGKQEEPVPGVHNSQWVMSPGMKRLGDPAAWKGLEKYVKDMVGSFGKDKRIVIWDLYNEPGKSQELVKAAFQWAREKKPSQPLTSCWIGEPYSDIINFHNYDSLEKVRQNVEDLMKKHEGRPIICTEYMRRPESQFNTHLSYFKEKGIGCWNWGLVAGRTQTYYPWGSPKDAPEPKVWFHDILRKDGAPFNADEAAFLRKTTDAPSVNRLKPLFDFPVRDTCVSVGPDQMYYLIGTTGAPSWWTTNEGIRVWKSRDLKQWEPLGLVWSFEKNMTWQKKKGEHQAIWAPELHYMKGTFWIAYCVNYSGTGILRSKTGKAEGPYEDVKPDGPLTGEIDASLFQDDDGKVYFVYQNGKIAPMKDDMSGLAETPRLLQPGNAQQVGFEGAFMFKANGRYFLSCAEFKDGRYHCYVASSPRLYGPYGEAYLAVPHGGHNMFFKDLGGNWWSTFFGNDDDAPFRERPGLLRIEFGLDGEPRPMPVR